MGLEMDETKAFGWYKTAANLGDTASVAACGSCYAQGRGVAQAPPRAPDYNM